MQMEIDRPSRRPFWRSRWWMPLFSLGVGAFVFAAFAIGGRTGDGLRGFAVMAALAALFYFGGRSDTLRGLGGPGRDERWAAIDLRASAFAGVVVIGVNIAAWLWRSPTATTASRTRSPAPSPAWPTSSASPSCAGARERYFA